MDRWAAADRVGRIDHRLAGERRGASSLSASSATAPATASTTTSPKAAVSAKPLIFAPGCLAAQSFSFRGLAGGDRHRVAVFQESGRERLPDHARADDADLHGAPPPFGHSGPAPV